ncbi:MAG TPA: hypothetical protein VH914_16450 [Acidimicrobiia bacterium]|nr:hypothetical protein [Acidimicrobiia bacterium]
MHIGLAPSDDGRATYRLGTVADITQHVEASEALAQSEARYRALVESATLPLDVSNICSI